MNLQALMKQAQSLQKNMISIKKNIENKNFEGESELVKVVMNGKKEVISVKFKDLESIAPENIEILEDMVVIAINDAKKKVDAEISSKMGNQLGAFENFI